MQSSARGEGLPSQADAREAMPGCGKEGSGWTEALAVLPHDVRGAPIDNGVPTQAHGPHAPIGSGAPHSTETISRVIFTLLTVIRCTGVAVRPVSTGAALAASLPRVLALMTELDSHATERPHAELAQQLQVSRWLAYGLRAGSAGADAPGARCRSAPGWPSIPLTASRQRACP